MPVSILFMLLSQCFYMRSDMKKERRIKLNEKVKTWEYLSGGSGNRIFELFATVIIALVGGIFLGWKILG